MMNSFRCNKATRVLLICVYVSSTTLGCSRSDSTGGQVPSEQTTNSKGDRTGGIRKPKGLALPIPNEPVHQFVHSSFVFSSGKFQDFFETDRASYLQLSAHRRIGSYHDELPVSMLEAYLENESQPVVEIYLDLAIAYLTFGRFNDAAQVLKDAEAKSAEKLGGFVSVLSQHTDRLAQTLTAARNALLREGVKVTYPDRQIFERAWSLADPKDDYLRLNIVDACDSAFPDSLASTRWVIDANFSYLQSPSKETNVPGIRGQNAFDRAMEAALSLKDEKQQLYAAIRLTQTIIGRIDWDTGFLSRSDVDTLMYRSLKIDASPDVRSFLLYGQTLRSLKKGWERRGYVNELTKDMEEAVRLDGDQIEYAILLKLLKSNGPQIERQVIAARKRRQKISVARLSGFKDTLSDAEIRRQRANDLGSALIIGSIGLLVVAAMAGDDSNIPAQTVPKTTDCPYCTFGIENWSSNQCLYCRGTGQITNW